MLHSCNNVVLSTIFRYSCSIEKNNLKINCQILFASNKNVLLICHQIFNFVNILEKSLQKILCCSCIILAFLAFIYWKCVNNWLNHRRSDLRTSISGWYYTEQYLHNSQRMKEMLVSTKQNSISEKQFYFTVGQEHSISKFRADSYANSSRSVKIPTVNKHYTPVPRWGRRRERKCGWTDHWQPKPAFARSA
jgi:hypothetical protein